MAKSIDLKLVFDALVKIMKKNEKKIQSINRQQM